MHSLLAGQPDPPGYARHVVKGKAALGRLAKTWVQYLWLCLNTGPIDAVNGISESRANYLWGVGPLPNAQQPHVDQHFVSTDHHLRVGHFQVCEVGTVVSSRAQAGWSEKGRERASAFLHSTLPINR